jgi:hypothetical protein
MDPGYYIEQGFIVGQALIFIVLSCLQFYLWTVKRYFAKVRQIQRYLTIIVFIHNLFGILIGIDPHCIYQIWSPPGLLIIFNSLIQIHHLNVLMCWKGMCRIYTSDSLSGEPSVKFALSSAALSFVFFMALGASCFGTYLAVTQDRIQYEAIAIFSSSLLMIYVLSFTAKFISMMQKVKREASTFLENEAEETVRRWKLEHWIYTAWKILIALLLLMSGAGAADVWSSSQTLSEVILVKDPGTYKLLWTVPVCLGLSIFLSVIFMIFTWLPIRDLWSKPVQQPQRPFKHTLLHELSNSSPSPTVLSPKEAKVEMEILPPVRESKSEQ